LGLTRQNQPTGVTVSLRVSAFKENRGCSAWLDLSHLHRASEQIILPNDIVLKIGRDQRVVFATELR